MSLSAIERFSSATRTALATPTNGSISIALAPKVLFLSPYLHPDSCVKNVFRRDRTERRCVSPIEAGLVVHRLAS